MDFEISKKWIYEICTVQGSLTDLLLLQDNICDEVFETLTYFMHIEDRESSLFALRSVGSMCIRHYDYMLGAELMTHYQMLLRGEDTAIPMKVQVSSLYW